MAYNYTTTGTIAGSPPNIVFNPQSAAVIGSTDGAGNALDLALGSFTLSKPGGGITDTFNNAFMLDIAFAIPSVSGVTTFNAELTGTLKNGTGQYDVNLQFSPSSKVFDFTSPFNGSFTFTVNDILGMDYSAGGPATYLLTGDLTNASETSVDTTPEPSSVFLLVTVVGGVGLAMRRRLLQGDWKA